MSHRSIAVAGLAIVCLTALGGTAAAALQPVPVKHTPLREELPAAGGTIFAWSQNSAGHPGVDNIWVEVSGGGAVRLNPPHTFAEAGGVDGDEVIFDQIEPERPQRHQDLERHDPDLLDPAGVDTQAREYWPTKSGPWILYGRLGRHADRALLHNTATGDTVVLATAGTGRL